MICRRKHTANFTTIGNDLFDDERLAADEVGVLSYLLSRPNDWEVRRPALGRRWRIGRERIARILFSLIRYGWIVAKRDRLSNGTFFVVYEVRDQPGPEMTVEEAKSATSLVSSDAEDADSNEAENGHERVTDTPDTGDPDTAHPDTGNPLAPYKEDSLKTESLRNDFTQGGRAFSDVCEAWPSDHVLSIVACEAQHAGLTDGTKESAFRGIKPYIDDCHAQNRKVCDLATYYRERRWERFQQKTASNTMCAVRPGTPQWYRWREHYIAVGKSTTFMDSRATTGSPLTFPTEWPPAIGATGPPVAA